MAEEERRVLGGAVRSGDGAEVVALLAGTPPGAHLQHAGDGLLSALQQGVEGAPALARACVAALRARDWIGDEELAAQLDSALGDGPAPLLRPLPVDLEELAMLLEGDPLQGGGRIDLTTGEIWHQAAIDYAVEVGDEDEYENEDIERWLPVECEGSRAGYRDMVRFIATIDDAERADRLDIAISGRGAFRRFKDVLARWPGELDRWFAFSEERQRGRTRAWLAEHGLRPAVRSGPPG